MATLCGEPVEGYAKGVLCVRDAGHVTGHSPDPIARELDRLRAERDQARRIAVALEQELAQLYAHLASVGYQLTEEPGT